MEIINPSLKISFQKLKSITKKTVDKSYDFEVENTHRIIARKKGSAGAFYTSNCDHPDIEEYVTAKLKAKVLTKFNLSVMITDKFLQAVTDDEYWDLKFDGKVYKRVKAKGLYDLITKSTYVRNEPGVLFYDNMQKNNPISYLGPLVATNPCVVRDTLILTTQGWIKIKNLFEEFESRNLKIQIVTKDKDGVLYNSDLTNVMLTDKNAQLYKTNLNNREFLITNDKHKFYTTDFSQISVKELYDKKISCQIVSGNGEANLDSVEKLEMTDSVFDLTAVPNYNFFSLLNKEEIRVEEKIVINNNLELDYFSVVRTVKGQKFAYELEEGEELV